MNRQQKNVLGIVDIHQDYFDEIRRTDNSCSIVIIDHCLSFHNIKTSVKVDVDPKMIQTTIFVM